MPTYDYRCSECQKSFAVEQSMLDKPLKKCRACGGKLEKMLPKSVNLIFKGSGFYVTDYKSGGGSEGKRSEARSAGRGSHKVSGSGKASGKSGASDESDKS